MLSAESVQHQWNSYRKWVPFVACLLGNHPISSGSKHTPIPIDDPDSVTRETLLAIQEILPKAVWHHLIHIAGWQSIRFMDPASEKMIQGRLWNQTTIQNDSLTFTASSVNFLLRIYQVKNGSAEQNKGIYEKIMFPPSARTNGDLLLEWVGCRQISKFNINVEISLESPLVLLEFFGQEKAQLLPEKTITTVLRQCGAAGLLPWFPWLGLHWSKLWANRYVMLWEKDMPDHNSHNGHIQLVQDWQKFFSEQQRHDLLIPLLDYYIQALKPASQLERFKEVSQRKSMKTRSIHQAKLEIWIRWLRGIHGLQQIFVDGQRMPVIDRMPTIRIFMDGYSSRHFDNIVHQANTVLQEIDPVIG
ncbi:MAG: hypothetical protein HQM12_20390 [SAR324 cluster bacterium]|nr:hypothetical protein [SAR324 cluster bacterium]